MSLKFLAYFCSDRRDWEIQGVHLLDFRRLWILLFVNIEKV